MIRQTDLPKAVRKKRRRQLNASEFRSEEVLESELIKRNLVGYEKNFCLENRFFGDFVWQRIRLVVEVDGSSHDDKKGYDKQRDSFLKRRRWDVYRISYPYTNEDLLKLLDIIEPKVRKIPKPRIKKRRLVERANKGKVRGIKHMVAQQRIAASYADYRARVGKFKLKRNKPVVSVIKDDGMSDTMRRGLRKFLEVKEE